MYVRKTGESKETCSSRNAISKQQFIRRFGDKLGWGTKKLHQVRIKVELTNTLYRVFLEYVDTLWFQKKHEKFLFPSPTEIRFHD